MKILYLHRTQGEEPESIHIREIIGALINAGHEIRVVGPVKWGATSAPTRPSRLSVVKKWLPRWMFEWLQIAYNANAYRQLVKEISVFKPDFIYERYALYGFAGVMAARKFSVPLILEVNTPYAFAWATYYGLRMKRLARWLEKKVLNRADSIITVTHAQRKFLLETYAPGKRIVVSHNAIDPEKFHPHLSPDETVIRQLAIPQGGMVVGFVGTMNRWQGIPGFKEVVPYVMQRAPGVRFLFVGEGEYRRELEQTLIADGHGGKVVFTGRRTHREVPALVSAMDVAVLLNSNDYGSPMKIFEYWAMGKAVIAPRVGPVEEVMRDGDTGLLIERGDAMALAECIVRLYSDPVLRRRLGDSGRAYVLENHTWQKNAQQILDEFTKLDGRTSAN